MKGMKTKGMCKILSNSTYGMGSSYQSKSSPKNLNNDTEGKLVIQNYSKSLGSGVIWGWDLVDVFESEDNYSFTIQTRVPNNTINITLGRYLQTKWLGEPKYQLYITDDSDNWSESRFIGLDKLSYSKFWEVVEELIGLHIKIV